ncbi:MAG: glycosyltransferase family 2 protein [Bacilli bacterium]|jgi:glycosyltransferase involved in cell wall biosynthesis|nr:glycosyltransferase family 2 protein [Prevotella sp.]MBR0439250.1 glycosyltransferase family 2 protein [Bacilli bacterium]
MGKISVVINTYNAEKHLQRVLDSVNGFDEILICDMESTDSTLTIAKKNNCKIVIFPNNGYLSAEPARTFAIQSASNPWVLVVDADELITESLRKYLYNYIEKRDCAQGLFIPRLNKFMEKNLKCAYPDYQLRFFIKEGTEWPPYVHTFPKVNGRLEKLPKDNMELAMIHLANDSIHSIMEKDNRYSDNDVDKKANKKYGMGALLYRPFWRFFKCYVLESGWRDGIRGLIYAGLKGVYQFELVAKHIEKRLT